MAVTSTVYLRALRRFAEGNVNWETDTIKLALLSSSYTPDLDNHDYFNDVSAYEISGSGYTAGGATLANRSFTVDTANDRVYLNADNVSWASATFTARYAVVYKDTGTASTSPILVLIDFGQDYSVSGATFSIEWSSGHVAYFTNA